MTLIAIVAALAILVAGLSLVRLSRKPLPPPPEPEARTFDTLRAGDVLVTPAGDWLVEAGGEPLPDGARSSLFALRAGRQARFLFVPPEGPLRLLRERPDTAANALGAEGEQLERATVDLLPGT
jgi:hypothetical protein